MLKKRLESVRDESVKTRWNLKMCVCVDFYPYTFTIKAFFLYNRSLITKKGDH